MNVKRITTETKFGTKEEIYIYLTPEEFNFIKERDFKAPQDIEENISDVPGLVCFKWDSSISSCPKEVVESFIKELKQFLEQNHISIELMMLKKQINSIENRLKIIENKLQKKRILNPEDFKFYSFPAQLWEILKIKIPLWIFLILFIGSFIIFNSLNKQNRTLTEQLFKASETLISLKKENKELQELNLTLQTNLTEKEKIISTLRKKFKVIEITKDSIVKIESIIEEQSNLFQSYQLQTESLSFLVSYYKKLSDSLYFLSKETSYIHITEIKEKPYFFGFYASVSDIFNTRKQNIGGVFYVGRTFGVFGSLNYNFQDKKINPSLGILLKF